MLYSPGVFINVPQSFPSKQPRIQSLAESLSRLQADIIVTTEMPHYCGNDSEQRWIFNHKIVRIKGGASTDAEPSRKSLTKPSVLPLKPKPQAAAEQVGA
jgi:hypothetical protein